MAQNTQAIAAAAQVGVVVIALSQSRADLDAAIAQVRNNDPTALGKICQAVDSAVAGYRAALEILMPQPIIMEPRIWDISEGID